MYWQENYSNKCLATIIALSIAFATPLLAINEPATSVSNQQDQTSTPLVNRSAVKRPTSLMQNTKTRLKVLREYLHTKKERCKAKFKAFTEKHPDFVFNLTVYLGVLAFAIPPLYVDIRINGLPHASPTGHYAALGLAASATQEEIEAACEQRLRLPWVLKVPILSSSSKRREYLERITLARDVLTNPNKRQLYDGARLESNGRSYSMEQLINEKLKHHTYTEERGNTRYIYKRYCVYTDAEGRRQEIYFKDVAEHLLNLPDYQTAYDTLGLAPTATDEDIRRAYKTKALECHPDRNLDTQQEATEQFRTVQNAYEILSDPAQRSAYDARGDLRLCEQCNLPLGFFRFLSLRNGRAAPVPATADPVPTDLD